MLCKEVQECLHDSKSATATWDQDCGRLILLSIAAPIANKHRAPNHRHHRVLEVAVALGISIVPHVLLRRMVELGCFRL